MESFTKYEPKFFMYQFYKTYLNLYIW